MLSSSEHCSAIHYDPSRSSLALLPSMFRLGACIMCHLQLSFSSGQEHISLVLPVGQLQAILNIISNPVNSTVPIAVEALKKLGVYDKRKVMGVSTLDVVRGVGSFFCFCFSVLENRTASTAPVPSKPPQGSPKSLPPSAHCQPRAAQCPQPHFALLHHSPPHTAHHKSHWVTVPAHTQTSSYLPLTCLLPALMRSGPR